MNRQVVITGANRGIGLELVRQYARSGWRVPYLGSGGSADSGRFFDIDGTEIPW